MNQEIRDERQGGLPLECRINPVIWLVKFSYLNVRGSNIDMSQTQACAYFYNGGVFRILINTINIYFIHLLVKGVMFSSTMIIEEQQT
jgi:hypothetical protein